MNRGRQSSILGVPLLLGPLFALLSVLALAAVAPQVWHQLTVGRSDRLVDLNVYRSAGLSLLHHRNVYDYVTPPPQNLPFTYPPTSALLSLPLALLPHDLVNVLWTLGCYVLVLGLTVVAFRAMLVRIGAFRTAWVLPVLFVAMSYLLPVRSVVHFGQVGLILAALCVADCLVPDSRLRWPRGVLVGLAAALKLTPAVFIPYLWLSGRRKAAYVAAGSFIGLVGLTWAITPSTSTRYWLHALWDSGRLGDNTNTSNQALRGVTLRADLGSGVLAALVVIVAVVGFWRASRASRGGNELAGVALAGLLAVLLSPVAWIHHMVWIILVIGVIVGAGVSVRRVLVAAAVTVFFVLSVPWIGDHAIFRHLPKTELSYEVPAGSWTAFPLSGPLDVPAGTQFRLRTSSGYQELSTETRNYLSLCSHQEPDCESPRSAGSAIWPQRLVQSGFGLAAVLLVFFLPISPITRRDHGLSAPKSGDLGALSP